MLTLVRLGGTGCVVELGVKFLAGRNDGCGEKVERRRSGLIAIVARPSSFGTAWGFRKREA